MGEVPDQRAHDRVDLALERRRRTGGRRGRACGARGRGMASRISARIGHVTVRRSPVTAGERERAGLRNIVARQPEHRRWGYPHLGRQRSAWSPGAARRHASTAYRQRPPTSLSKEQTECTPTRSPRAPAAGAPSTARRRSGAGSRFVVVAFVIGGAVGVKKPDDYIGPGDSGRADQLALDHFPKDADRERPHPGAQGRLGPGRRRPPGRRRRDRRRLEARPRVAEVESPYAKGNEDQISKDGRSVLVTFKVRGDDDQTVEGDRPGRRRRRPREGAELRRLRRPVRRRERRQGAVEGVLGRLQEGREAVAADHAAHPRPRLRRARRRRHPAAARVERGHGDARPRRAAEPDHPDGRR